MLVCFTLELLASLGATSRAPLRWKSSNTVWLIGLHLKSPFLNRRAHSIHGENWGPVKVHTIRKAKVICACFLSFCKYLPPFQRTPQLFWPVGLGHQQVQVELAVCLNEATDKARRDVLRCNGYTHGNLCVNQLSFLAAKMSLETKEKMQLQVSTRVHPLKQLLTVDAQLHNCNWVNGAITVGLRPLEVAPGQLDSSAHSLPPVDLCGFD